MRKVIKRNFSFSNIMMPIREYKIQVHCEVIVVEL